MTTLTEIKKQHEADEAALYIKDCGYILDREAQLIAMLEKAMPFLVDYCETGEVACSLDKHNFIVRDRVNEVKALLQQLQGNDND